MNEINHKLDVSLGNRAFNKAVQVLTGIITGIVADGQLHDMEVQLLNTWLTENEAVTASWPGSAIYRLVREVLEDGHISDEERQHLLQELQGLVGSDFSDTGSASSEVSNLPFDKDGMQLTPEMRICFTGVFIFGTRSACEKLASKAGYEIASNVSKKTHALIVGSHISPDWINTSYGTKIARAMELRDQGHQVLIIRERHWIESLQQIA